MKRTFKRRHPLTLSSIACVLALSAGGCRFGNHVEQQQDPDQVSGYYETKLEELELATSVNPTMVAQPLQPIVPVVGPVFGRGIVRLVMVELDTGLAAAVWEGYQNGDPLQQLFVDQDSGLIGIEGEYPPETALVESVCKYRQTVRIMGNYSRTGPFEVPTSQSVRGRLAFEALVRDTFEPAAGAASTACDATMALLEACYADESDCGSTDPTENHQRHEKAVGYFGTFVNAGLLAPSQISQAIQLTYRAAYH
jgi:hypothetical protein